MIEMLLFCPRCALQHVDPRTMRPHATHLCHGCGLLWRPANAETWGVKTIEAMEPHHFERIQATNPALYRRRRPDVAARNRVMETKYSPTERARRAGAMSAARADPQSPLQRGRSKKYRRGPYQP